MRRNAKRLFLSLILSLLCAMAVQYWYQSNSGIIVDYGNRKPIAQITEVTNEAQKKPLKRLVWRGLSANEALYAGETIRTTESSQTKIVFTASGTEINLEPDSMIVIDEDSKGLTLEFLKGFLVVKGQTNDTMTLKSGNNTVGVSGTELSLGKGDSGNVQLQVFKGEPKIQGSEFKRVQDSFKIKSPVPNSVVHVLPDGKDPVLFEWAALDKPHEFQLEVGLSRSQMKPIEMAMESSNKGRSFLAPGDYFWRVIAKPDSATADPVISSVYRLRVLPKRPPIAVAPENKKLFVSPLPEQQVQLRWVNPGQLDQLVLQIADSADLKSGLKTISGLDVDSTELTLKSNRSYFWRVTGYIPETKEPVVGAVQSFTLKVPDEFKPPVPIKPAAGEVFPIAEVNLNGVAFRWATAQGAEFYQLRLRPVQNIAVESVFPETPSPLTSLTVKDLKPGDYEWEIVSYDGDQKPLKPTARRRFKIADVNRINFVNNASEEIQFYYSSPPSLLTSWQPGPKGTVQYRVLWHVADSSDPSQVITTAVPSMKIEVATPGRIVIAVEALNNSGIVVARTSEKIIDLREAPLLPAPTLAQSLPDPLTAGRNGKLDLSWSQIEGATEYLLEVRKPGGEIVREEKASRSAATINKLLPGDYQINVRGVDKAGRRGIASSTRPLIVPAVSDVSAPQMKKIKIE